MIALLAQASEYVKYTPFIDPLHVDAYWLPLLLPLVFAIAIVYKAIRLEDDELKALPRAVLSLAAQIVLFMGLAAAGLWLVSEIF